MISLEFDINENMAKIWVPANVGVVDESLVAHKGRNNPHHVFIMRKPKPHGLKNWSLVDYSGYFLKFSMFRRDRTNPKATYEAVHDTVIRMTQPLSSCSLVVGDSYFGSLKSMEELVKQGKHCIFSCTQNRPSLFFRQNLCSLLKNDGDCAALYGEINGVGGEVPFLASSFLSKGRKLNTIGTVSSGELKEVTCEALLPDGSEEKQCTFQRISEKRPEIRTKYMEIMDAVDCADQHISAALIRNRKYHWSSAQQIWVITMLLVVNSKKTYESASGEECDGPTWRKNIRKVLLGFDDIQREHPSSVRLKRAPKARCAICSKKTTWRCPVCGPICKNCEKKRNQHQSPHLSYAQSPHKTRRRYFGRKGSE